MEFMGGRDVFVSLPTGSGESICFICLPHIFDELRKLSEGQNHHNSIVVVVSPLPSLMLDQVAKASAKGMRAVCIGRDQLDFKVGKAVENGGYQLLYISPEAMLSSLRWREMFLSTVYQHNLVCLAIDEAHLVEKWCVASYSVYSYSAST